MQDLHAILDEITVNLLGFDGEQKLIKYDLEAIQHDGEFYFDPIKCKGWIKSVELNFQSTNGTKYSTAYNLVWAEITHKIITSKSKMSAEQMNLINNSPAGNAIIRVLVDGTYHEMLPNPRPGQGTSTNC